MLKPMGKKYLHFYAEKFCLLKPVHEWTLISEILAIYFCDKNETKDTTELL